MAAGLPRLPSLEYALGRHLRIGNATAGDIVPFPSARRVCPEPHIGRTRHSVD